MLHAHAKLRAVNLRSFTCHQIRFSLNRKRKAATTNQPADRAHGMLTSNCVRVLFRYDVDASDFPSEVSDFLLAVPFAPGCTVGAFIRGLDFRLNKLVRGLDASAFHVRVTKLRLPRAAPALRAATGRRGRNNNGARSRGAAVVAAVNDGASAAAVPPPFGSRGVDNDDDDHHHDDDDDDARDHDEECGDADADANDNDDDDHSADFRSVSPFDSASSKKRDAGRSARRVRHVDAAERIPRDADASSGDGDDDDAAADDDDVVVIQSTQVPAQPHHRHALAADSAVTSAAAAATVSSDSSASGLIMAMMVESLASPALGVAIEVDFSFVGGPAPSDCNWSDHMAKLDRIGNSSSGSAGATLMVVGGRGGIGAYEEFHDSLGRGVGRQCRIRIGPQDTIGALIATIERSEDRRVTRLLDATGDFAVSPVEQVSDVFVMDGRIVRFLVEFDSAAAVALPMAAQYAS